MKARIYTLYFTDNEIQAILCAFDAHDELIELNKPLEKMANADDLENICEMLIEARFGTKGFMATIVDPKKSRHLN